CRVASSEADPPKLNVKKVDPLRLIPPTAYNYPLRFFTAEDAEYTEKSRKQRKAAGQHKPSAPSVPSVVMIFCSVNSLVPGANRCMIDIKLPYSL
ncbi:hypothetical protein MNBD_GAMMA10-2020, partial [hydrothermal vent metagenome]